MMSAPLSAMSILKALAQFHGEFPEPFPTHSAENMRQPNRRKNLESRFAL